MENLEEIKIELENLGYLVDYRENQKNSWLQCTGSPDFKENLSNGLILLVIAIK